MVGWPPEVGSNGNRSNENGGKGLSHENVEAIAEAEGAIYIDKWRNSVTQYNFNR